VFDEALIVKAFEYAKFYGSGSGLEVKKWKVKVAVNEVNKSRHK
jgi:hypothetical protein